MGQPKVNRQVSLYWEVFATDDNNKPIRTGDGRPFSLFKNYNLSWNEKAALRKHLQAWRNKPFSQEEMQSFDLKNILDKWCNVAVIHKTNNDGKTFANLDNISPVSPLQREVGLPAPSNKAEMFTIQNPDMAMFETFNDNLKKKIMSSPEWQRLHAGNEYQRTAIAEAHTPHPPEDEDIPF
jgi:hypothetical protein